jgi:hypothetical protein
MDKEYNVFQWSMFIGGREGEQVVVRGDDWKQFILDVEAVRKQFNVRPIHVELIETTSNYSAPQDRVNETVSKAQGEANQFTREPIKIITKDPAFCEVHQVEMKPRMGGKFFSHGKKIGEDEFEWCSGKGFGVK